MRLAEILLRVFIAIAPAGILFLGKAQLDLRIILFTAFLSLFCAILFGLVPALQEPQRDRACRTFEEFRGTRRGATELSSVANRDQYDFAVWCDALAASLWSLQGQNLGMQTRHVLTASVSLSEHYETSQKQMAFYRQAELALRRLPCVTAVGLSDSLPVGGIEPGGLSGRIAVAGEPPPTGDAGIRIVWRWVTPDYFRALDIPMLQGQNFTGGRAKLQRAFSDFE